MNASHLVLFSGEKEMNAGVTRSLVTNAVGCNLEYSAAQLIGISGVQVIGGELWQIAAGR